MPDASSWDWTESDVRQLLGDSVGDLVSLAAMVAVALIGFALLSRIAR